MTHDEILQLLYDETLVGNAPAVKEGVEQGLDDGLEPERMLYDALIPSLEEVGARFERGDYFVPEMLIAARAMQGALDILRPLLAETGTKPVGTFLMGTVKGDVHDIGKNLCNIMLEGAGFDGDRPRRQRRRRRSSSSRSTSTSPTSSASRAFLTTTMPMFKANINALQKAGIRDKVIVMVGGAPVTQEYADAVGADGYSADASSAVKKAKELIEQRRAHGAGLMDTVLSGRGQDRHDRPRPAVLHHRRAHQPDRAQGVRRGAARRRPLDGRRRHARRRSRRAPTCSTSTPASRSSTRPSCWPRCSRSSRTTTDVADLHRLLGDRGARGRARRLRGQGARELGHRRGRAAGGDPAAGGAPRRGGDRPRQRRDRHPRDAAAAAGDRAPRSCRAAGDHGIPPEDVRDRPAGDDRRRRHRGGHDDARDDPADPRRARREHVAWAPPTSRSACRSATCSTPRSCRWRWPPA